MSDKTDDLIMVGALALGGYMLYLLLSSKSANAGTNPSSTIVGNPVSAANATSPNVDLGGNDFGTTVDPTTW